MLPFASWVELDHQTSYQSHLDLVLIICSHENLGATKPMFNLNDLTTTFNPFLKNSFVSSFYVIMVSKPFSFELLILLKVLILNLAFLTHP